MSIKLIAIDLDGTLLDADKNIAPADKEAVGKAVKAGYTVTLATGRMFRSAKPYADELGLTQPLVVYNGALIKDLQNGSELGCWPLPLPTAQEVLDDCLNAGIYIQAYVNDCLWTLKDCEEVRFYSKFSRVPYEVKGEDMHHLPASPHKLLVITGNPASIREKLMKKYARRIKIVSSSRGFLEITAPQTNKWHALQVLGHYLGIQPEEMMCIGDSDNDYEMVAHSGLGVAMGNAQDRIIKAARVVTGSNERQGVSMVLNSIMTRQVSVPED